jgi:phospholipase/carboxylesterase
MTASAPDNLVILLHGVGSSGSDIAGLGAAWHTALPGTVFAAPNAPSPSSFGAAYQWFSVAGVTEANRPERILAARAAFDAVISGLIEEHGFAGRLSRVAFAGFSQGTIMALDAVASGRWPVAGVAGFSGRLASPAPLSPSLKTSILLIHGDADSVIPVSETVKAAATLKGLGLSVASEILPGVGHTVDRQGAEFGAAFLSGLFGV